jgi:GntR family transcriptional regulator
MIRINPSTGLPVYLQIIEQVKHLIETGELGPAATLPSVRNLAAQLSISPNTVIKAYTELEHQGVIELRMGSGAYVRREWVSQERPERIRAASEQVREVVGRLRADGFSADEIRRLFEAELIPVTVSQDPPEAAAAAAGGGN